MRKSNEGIIYRVREFFMIDEVEEKYKSRPADFTRNRKLPFKLLVVFMLRKLYKNLALEIGEFFKELAQPEQLLSKSAFVQARQKVYPLFFRDLLYKFNQEFYTDNDERVKKLKGMRILAVDGSTLDLPFSAELAAYYGIQSNYPEVHYIKGRVSLLYDLLGGMILDGVLQPFAQGEAKAAYKHLDHCQKGDLLVYDRGYASFEMIYTHLNRGLQLLMRMRAGYSLELTDFAQGSDEDVIIWMSPSKTGSVKGKAYGKQAQVRVRLVKFTLTDGETALLLTTLLDKEQYPVALLKQLYGMRWGVETTYDVLKNVLKIESFSGLSRLAIEQDFYISLFLLNMQALLADELQEELKERYGHRKYEYKINVATAIGEMKKNIVALFVENEPGKILLLLKEAFLQHVEPVRPNRKYPREKDKYRRRKKLLVLKNRRNVL